MANKESQSIRDDIEELGYQDAVISLDFSADLLERNHRLRQEFDALQEELHVEESRVAQEIELSRQLEENVKRLEAEIAELEQTRHRLMAEKSFWDYIANFPDDDHRSDFFMKNRSVG